MTLPINSCGENIVQAGLSEDQSGEHNQFIAAAMVALLVSVAATYVAATYVAATYVAATYVAVTADGHLLPMAFQHM